MGKKSKIISLIVSVAMLVAMFPMIVHADEAPGTFADLQAAIDAADGYLSLSRDYIAADGEDGIVLENGKSITLDLNGHTIDRNLSSAQQDGHVFTIRTGAQLVLTTGSGDAGVITGGYAYYGGGIYVDIGGTLVFQQGVIAGNKVTTVDGVENSGRGAGVYVVPSGYVSMCPYGEYVASIVGNTGAQQGGGIYLEGYLSVTAGKISDNPLAEGGKGSGVYVASSASFDVTGNPIINDVFLTGTKKISVTNTLSATSRIAVSTEADLPAAVTTGYAMYTPAGVEASTIFSSPQGSIDTSEGGEVTITSGGGQQIDTPVKIKTCNVTLGGTLGVNVYVDYGNLDAATKEAATVTMSISGKGGKEKTYTFADAVPRDFDGTTCYGYTYEISSIQMADTIKVTVSYEGHDPVEAEFSVEDYITAFVSNYLDYGYTYDDSLVFMMIANYGFYIQRYLDNINDGWSVANNDHLEFTTRYHNYNSTFYNIAIDGTKDAKYLPQKSVDENSTITKMTYSLEFGTTIALEVFFTVAPGSDFSASAYCEHTGKTYRAYLADDGRYKIRVSGISVQELGDMFISITGTAGSDFTVNVHPFGYIYNAVSSSSTAEKAQLKKDAMTALYLFYAQIQPKI